MTLFAQINRAAPGTSIAERMLRRIKKSEDINACWSWIGATHPRGYASLIDNETGRSHYAHRFMYEQTFGPIPPGMNVCHHCDNPPCSNPRHLFLGTNNDNSQDAARKSRMLQKLAVRDVIVIKKAIALGIHPARIAKKLKISHHNIKAIRDGEIHRYITPDRFNFDAVEINVEDFPLIPFKRIKNPNLLPCLKAVRDGMGICKASREFDISLSLLSRIKNGKHYRSLEGIIAMIEDGYDGTRLTPNIPKKESKPKSFMSARQIEVMTFVRKRIMEDYCPPTLRELGEAMGVTSTNGVRALLLPLYRRGLIEKSEHKSRGLRLTALGKSETWMQGA